MVAIVKVGIAREDVWVFHLTDRPQADVIMMEIPLKVYKKFREVERKWWFMQSVLEDLYQQRAKTDG